MQGCLIGISVLKCVRCAWNNLRDELEDNLAGIRLQASVRSLDQKSKTPRLKFTKCILVSSLPKKEKGSFFLVT